MANDDENIHILTTGGTIGGLDDDLEKYESNGNLLRKILTAAKVKDIVKQFV